jgi:energy-coupling factor transporter ATP-binding protein EcfA2
MEINEFKQAPEETVEHKRHNSLDNEGNAVGQNETAVGGAKPPDGLAAHLNYVLAERDKRARALWAETPAGKEALRHLIETCKLREATIRKYHMGLITFRAQGAGQPIMNALCVPVSDKRGSEFAPCLAAERPAAKRRGQYVLLAIPGLTANAKGTQQWKRGPVLTMYTTPEMGNDLVVSASTLDAIILAQELAQRCPNRFTIIASTHLNERPTEWDAPEFWARWQRVYLAHGNDRQGQQVGFVDRQEVLCNQLANLARRPVLRVRIPEEIAGGHCVDWPGYFRAGGTSETALELFERSQVLTKRLSLTESLSSIAPPRLDEFAEGEFGDVTHDVGYNYVGGFYYYPFSVLHFSVGTKQQKQITRQTRLLRNDGRILGWTRVPSSNGASDVIAADDGTLLSRPPEVSESATWSLEHILAYARAAKAGMHKGRPLANILRDMLKLLEECFWLPHREQFYLLLFTLPVTYVQELFSAVPYILIQGPKGSGKSELANMLNWLSSNSTIIGSGSHAFTAAQVDQARGLIVLDDRETLAAADLDSNMLELLKIGYKRATGIRGIIGQNRKIIRQHVYGVKAITCIAGVEEIVGTRMLHVRTAPYNKARAKTLIRRFQATDQETAQRLRQELHGWAFNNVNRIKAEYEKLAQPGSRWDEITSPLLTFASLCGDVELQDGLNDAINAQGRKETADDSVEDVLGKAMEDLIRRGFTHAVSVTHIKNELASRLAEATKTTDPAWACEAWITRTLKAQGWLKPGATVRRTRVRKKVLQRIWELDPARVTEIVEHLTERSADLDPLSFCQSCGCCEYRSVCPIRKYFETNGTKQTAWSSSEGLPGKPR